MTSTTRIHPSAPSGIVRAPGELLLLHRRALHATAAVIDRAVLHAADDPRVEQLVETAVRGNLVASEYLGRWDTPALAEGTLAARFHRSAELVDEAACRPGALRSNVPLAGGAVGEGAALRVERMVALDRAGRALAAIAAVHRTVDAELDLVVARLGARIRSGSRPLVPMATAA